MSSPHAGWTRKPPKPAPKKKKKKLVAGRELRDRKQRKTYAESSASDEDFLELDDDDDEDEDEENQQDEQFQEDVREEDGEFDEEDAPPAPKTRKIVLRLKADLLQELSQESMPPEQAPGPNGNATPAPDITEDLEAEIADLKEEMIVEVLDEDEEDYQPRRLTRRSTRQSSLSTQKENVNDRPTHGRKGVARQDGTSEKTNGDGLSARRRRLENLSRKSYEEKKKKKPHVSESEFEDDGEEEPDDEVSAVSENDDEGSHDEYSSPARRPKKKSSQSRPKTNKKRSRRNSSEYDDESIEDGVDDLEEELREIGAEIPQRQRQLRPTERMNYFIPPPPDKDDSFFAVGSPTKKRANAGRGLGGFGGFGGDFAGMGLSDRFRGVAGLGTAGGADDSSDSVRNSIRFSF